MNANHWFTNNGQIIQLVVAILGVGLTGINAWPAISNFQFFNFAPLAFYFFVFTAAVAFVMFVKPTVSDGAAADSKKKSSKILTRLLSDAASSYQVCVCQMQIDLIKGNEWTGGSDLQKLRMIYHDLVKENDHYRADIELLSTMSDFVGGSLTKAVATGRRFLIPMARAEYSAEPYSIFSFSFTDDLVRFDFIRITHINVHSGAIRLFVCRGHGYKKDA